MKKYRDIINKLHYLLFFTVACSVNSNGQSDSLNLKRSIIRLEYNGIGGFGSINYQRMVLNTTKLDIGYRAGFSTNNLYDFNQDFNPDAIIPLGIVGYYGNKHKLELGLGQTISSIVKVDRKDWNAKRYYNFHSTATIGYNYHTKYNFIYGVIINPILIENKILLIHYGIYIGYKF